MSNAIVDFSGSQQINAGGHALSVPTPPDDRIGISAGEWSGHSLDENGKHDHRTIPFEWRTKDILVLRNVLSLEECAVAVKLFEELDAEQWTRTDVVTNDNTPEVVYEEGQRNNDAITVWKGTDPRLETLERSMMVVSQAAAHSYMTGNPYVDVKNDMGYLLNRYREGEYFKPHVDVVRAHPVLALRRLTMVVYLNGGDDLEGGETAFPRDDIKITPEAGLAVVFPAGVTHPHESCEVVKGTKYAIACWYV